MIEPSSGDATPQAAGPQAEVEAALAREILLIQHCGACARYSFPPRRRCPHCGADALSLVPASGRGYVHATTVIARRAEQGGDYNLVLVELEEGFRLMSRVEDLPPQAVTIGMPVRAAFRGKPPGSLLVFLPEVRA